MTIVERNFWEKTVSKSDMVESSFTVHFIFDLGSSGISRQEYSWRGFFSVKNPLFDALFSGHCDRVLPRLTFSSANARSERRAREHFNKANDWHAEYASQNLPRGEYSCSSSAVSSVHIFWT